MFFITITNCDPVFAAQEDVERPEYISRVLQTMIHVSHPKK